mmetsp:Transcript_5057/g.10659  ORF Transcript_5057/g.10659 Transcript_5057/m.10659 type:complete len:214 (-) Transcript_5057:1755-2396(-)
MIKDRLWYFTLLIYMHRMVTCSIDYPISVYSSPASSSFASSLIECSARIGEADTALCSDLLRLLPLRLGQSNDSRLCVAGGQDMPRLDSSVDDELILSTALRPLPVLSTDDEECFFGAMFNGRMCVFQYFFAYDLEEFFWFTMNRIDDLPSGVSSNDLTSAYVQFPSERRMNAPSPNVSFSITAIAASLSVIISLFCPVSPILNVGLGGDLAT